MPDRKKAAVQPKFQEPRLNGYAEVTSRSRARGHGRERPSRDFGVRGSNEGL